MMTENPCTASGCLGGCCDNITIFDDEDVITNTFPNATEVNTWQLQKAIKGELPDGVYYQYDGRGKKGMVIARIVGSCEHKNKFGDCDRHGSCSHAGENFKIGSAPCNMIRERLGLPTV